MRDLTVRDLIDLVLSQTTDPSDRIEKMFEWHFDRAKTIVTWWLGAASSIVIALIATYFSEKSRLTGWWAIVVLILAICSFVFALYRLYLMRRINREFIAALSLFSRLGRIEPFLRIYRDLV